MRSVLILFDKASGRVHTYEMGKLKADQAWDRAKWLCQNLKIPHLAYTPKNLGGVRIYLAVR